MAFHHLADFWLNTINEAVSQVGFPGSDGVGFPHGISSLEATMCGVDLSKSSEVISHSLTLFLFTWRYSVHVQP